MPPTELRGPAAFLAVADNLKRRDQDGRRPHRCVRHAWSLSAGEKPDAGDGDDDGRGRGAGAPTPAVFWRGPGLCRAAKTNLISAHRRFDVLDLAAAEVFRLDESRLADEILHDEVLEMLRKERMIPEQADFQAYKRRFRDMYTTLTEPVEELIHLPDGRSLRVSRSPHPLGGLLFSYEDVSGQLELERSRNTLAAVQQTTLDNLTQAVAVFGGDGRLKLWNRIYAELWGFSDELLAGEPHLAELYERACPS